MKPTKPDDERAVVDLLDVLLERGVVLQADVVVSVAGVPLVGVNLRAAIAGMATMTEYGLLESWDEELRERAAERSEAGGGRTATSGSRERAASQRDTEVTERPPGHSVTDQSRGDREPSEGRPAGHPPTANRPAESPRVADRDGSPTGDGSPTADSSLSADQDGSSTGDESPDGD